MSATMRAAVLAGGRLAVEDVPEPEPEPGQMLVRPLVCGVCGSDLHIRDHAEHVCSLLQRAGFRGFMDPDRPVVLGHEFCCETLERGERFARGERVVAQPFLMGRGGLALLGYSNDYPGAFAERMVLEEAAAMPVPDHVPTEIAALTEPLSVAVHAVSQGEAGLDAAFAVVGCGPVGLFVIARLKALGLGPVLAIEPNPARRALAERMGADALAEPGSSDIAAFWTGLGLPLGLSDQMAGGPRRRERAVLFECVGKPGMLMGVAEAAPVGATVVMVGTCMERDPIEPAYLIQKKLRLQFIFAYTADDFAAAFEMICASPDRLLPLVSRTVPLEEVDTAFDALIAGGADVKVLVAPGG